jgi:hypothetical protein
MGKRIARALAIVAAFLLLGFYLYGVLFGEQGAATPAPRTVVQVPREIEPAHEHRVAVASVEGTVERRTMASQWAPLHAGDVLNPDDIVQTGEDGRVGLRVGNTLVTMDPRTQIAVPAITATVSRVRLGEGRIAADVSAEGKGTFGVDIEGSDAVVETESGVFAVLNSGQGEAAVATKTGNVRLTAAGQTVKVGPGQQSLVRRARPPTPPQSIPGSLFLKVYQRDVRQRTRAFALRGETTPGAVISVNGRRVQVGADGIFDSTVALREGQNRLLVETRDVAGAKKNEEVRVVVDSQGPKVEGDVEW